MIRSNLFCASSSFTCYRGPLAVVLHLTCQVRVPLRRTPRLSGQRAEAPRDTIQDGGGGRGRVQRRCTGPCVWSPGSTPAPDPRDLRPLPPPHCEAASPVACRESVSSRAEARTSPVLSQRRKLSFASEPSAVLLYWHK